MFESILLDNFDAIHFLQSYGYKLTRIGGRTKFLTTCVFCGKKDHMGVNPDNKTVACFKCHSHGNFIRVISKLTNQSYSDTIDYLKKNIDPKKYNGAYIENSLSLVHEYKSLEDKVKPIKLPDGYISLHNKRIEYLDKRSLEPVSQDQINFYKMGVCYEGWYKNRIIVCDVDEQQVPIYWVARDFTGQAQKKDKLWNPPALEDGLGSADILFNWNQAKNYDVAVLTEGVFDSIYVGNNGLASYGAGLKQNHLYWIVRGGFKEVILLYDADVSDDFLDHTGCLLGTFVSVKICKLPKGDPDEYPKNILYKMLSEAPKFAPSLRLEKLTLT